MGAQDAKVNTVHHVCIFPQDFSSRMSDSSVSRTWRLKVTIGPPVIRLACTVPPPGSTSILLHSILNLKSALIASSASPNQVIRHQDTSHKEFHVRHLQILQVGGWILDPDRLPRRSHCGTRRKFIPLSYIWCLKSSHIALPAVPTQVIQLSLGGGSGGWCSFRHLQIRTVSQSRV